MRPAMVYAPIRRMAGTFSPARRERRIKVESFTGANSPSKSPGAADGHGRAKPGERVQVVGD